MFYDRRVTWARPLSSHLKNNPIPEKHLVKVHIILLTALKFHRTVYHPITVICLFVMTNINHEKYYIIMVTRHLRKVLIAYLQANNCDRNLHEK